LAEETLAEADRDNRHRRRLITAGRRLARSGLPTEALEKKAVGYDEVKTKAAPVCHRSIEPAVNCGIQFTGSHLNVQELVDPLLKRRIARHQVGFLSEIKRLIRVHAAKLRMQLVLQPPFCGIGDQTSARPATSSSKIRVLSGNTIMLACRRCARSNASLVAPGGAMTRNRPVDFGEGDECRSILAAGDGGLAVLQNRGGEKS
jgi:hypothetical protein